MDIKLNVKLDALVGTSTPTTIGVTSVNGKVGDAQITAQDIGQLTEQSDSPRFMPRLKESDIGKVPVAVKGQDNVPTFEMQWGSSDVDYSTPEQYGYVHGHSNFDYQKYLNYLEDPDGEDVQDGCGDVGQVINYMLNHYEHNLPTQQDIDKMPKIIHLQPHEYTLATPIYFSNVEREDQNGNFIRYRTCPDRTIEGSSPTRHSAWVAGNVSQTVLNCFNYNGSMTGKQAIIIDGVTNSTVKNLRIRVCDGQPTITPQTPGQNSEQTIQASPLTGIYIGRRNSQGVPSTTQVIEGVSVWLPNMQIDSNGNYTPTVCMYSNAWEEGLLSRCAMKAQIGIVYTDRDCFNWQESITGRQYPNYQGAENTVIYNEGNTIHQRVAFVVSNTAGMRIKDTFWIDNFPYTENAHFNELSECFRYENPRFITNDFRTAPSNTFDINPDTGEHGFRYSDNRSIGVNAQVYCEQLQTNLSILDIDQSVKDVDHGYIGVSNSNIEQYIAGQNVDNKQYIRVHNLVDGDAVSFNNTRINLSDGGLSSQVQQDLSDLYGKVKFTNCDIQSSGVIKVPKQSGDTFQVGNQMSNCDVEGSYGSLNYSVASVKNQNGDTVYFPFGVNGLQIGSSSSKPIGNASGKLKSGSICYCTDMSTDTCMWILKGDKWWQLKLGDTHSIQYIDADERLQYQIPYERVQESDVVNDVRYITSGYYLEGWYTSQDFQQESRYEFNQSVTQDLVLYAHFVQSDNMIYQSTDYPIPISGQNTKQFQQGNHQFYAMDCYLGTGDSGILKGGVQNNLVSNTQYFSTGEIRINEDNAESKVFPEKIFVYNADYPNIGKSKSGGRWQAFGSSMEWDSGVTTNFRFEHIKKTDVDTDIDLSEYYYLDDDSQPVYLSTMSNDDIIVVQVRATDQAHRIPMYFTEKSGSGNDQHIVYRVIYDGSDQSQPIEAYKSSRVTNAYNMNKQCYLQMTFKYPTNGAVVVKDRIPEIYFNTDGHQQQQS